MTTAYRIVQHQARLYAHAVTSSPENALQLDVLLEAAKPAQLEDEWHPLIATPFRYSIPVEARFEARFKPPESNIRVLYSSELVGTALYEHAYYFMLERIDLAPEDENGSRTLFSLFVNEKKITDITKHPRIKELTDRKNYFGSHEHIRKHPNIKAVKYPSCRDPESGKNFAVFDIRLLGKNIGEERAIGFVFRAKNRSLFWVEAGLKINWSEVN